MAEPLLPTPPTGSARRFLMVWPLTVALLIFGGIPALDLLLLGTHADPQTAWIEGISARKQAVAATAFHHPRLLVAGGSSGLFSVDAETLEAQVGVPAYNLATHAGLGLANLLADARDAARPGDTILLYLEYAQYVRKPLPLSPLERDALWSVHPARLRQIAPAEALLQVFANPLDDYRQGWERRNLEMARPGTADQDLRPYSMAELGPRGDYRASAPLDKPAPPFELRRLEAPRPEPARLLDEFFQWCAKHGVKVIAARPAVVRDPSAAPTAVDRAYRSLESFYRERRIPLLDTSAVFQLPAELFYDTEYHANAAGRCLITEALARALRPLFGKAPLPGEAICLLAKVRGDSVHTGSGPESRFVAGKDLHHPLCVTPAQVRELCQARAGSREKTVYFTDPEVGELLRQTDLKIIDERESEWAPSRFTLGQWVHLYPNHLFIMAQAGEFTTDLLADEVPRSFVQFLHPPGPKCAIIGTGDFAFIDETRFDAKAVELRVTTRAEWQRTFRFPAAMTLLSGAAVKKAPLFVEHSALCADARPGLAVAIYDPALGTIVRQGVFVGPVLTEWVQHEVRFPKP